MSFVLRLFDELRIRYGSNLIKLRLNPPETNLIDFKTEYPYVPEPERRVSLNLLAAAWGCNDIYAEHMPAIAADLLEDGYDSPSLRRLAGEIDITHRSDVAPLVEKVFHELNVPFPMNEKQAKLILTRQLAREVFAGKRNIFVASSHLEGVWWWDSNIQILGDLFQLNDSRSWEMKYRPSEEKIPQDMVAIFAKLAMLTDEQIASDDVAKL